MATQRHERDAQTLRRYLEMLPEVGNASEGSNTLQEQALEWGADPNELREFRNGNDAAISPRLVTAYTRLLGGNADLRGSDYDYGMPIPDPSTRGWYQSMIQQQFARVTRLRQFDIIDRTRPEAHSALNSWADLAVAGNVGEVDRFHGGFEALPLLKGRDVNQTFSRINENINRYLMPEHVKWMCFRGMVMNGDEFAEVGLEQDRLGRFLPTALSHRDPRTIFVNRNKDGSYDPERHWQQIPPGKLEPVAHFPVWKLVHFCRRQRWGATYGESIFEPLLRSYIQIEAMEGAMVVRRLERAAQRLKHLVDIGQINGETAIKKYLRDYVRRHRKVKVVDYARQFAVQKITPPVGEDVFVPKRHKDDPADVAVLEGDATIGETGDVDKFYAKWFAGLGPPRGHLGWEDGVIRSVLTDQHIVFARKVRTLQLRFNAGMNHLVWLHLILAGVDPRSVKYAIFPPSLGTKDELMRAQVQMLHAQTVKYLSEAFALTGEAPSPQWMLKTFMGLDEESLAGLDLKKVLIPTKPSGPSSKGSGRRSSMQKKSREHLERMATERRERGMSKSEQAVMAEAALTDPGIQQNVEHLEWMVNERKLKLRGPDAHKVLPAPDMPFSQTYLENLAHDWAIDLRDAA